VLEYALPKSVAQLRRFFRGSDCTGADPSQFSRKAPPGSSRGKPSIISPRFEEHIGGNPRMGCGLSRIAGVEPIEVIPGASVERLQKRLSRQLISQRTVQPAPQKRRDHPTDESRDVLAGRAPSRPPRAPGFRQSRVSSAADRRPR
jgi:hypothetical protein